jgi:hypothetical protein
VTLGDVFGDLFENAGSKDADSEVPEEASGEPENKEG